MMTKSKFKKAISLLKNNFVERARHFLSRFRKRKIKKDFCIISNNCWGGKVYQRFGKQYNSPTVGLYFFADDYIRFLKNLDYYFGVELKIIPVEQSRYYENLQKLNQTDVPIGRLDDVEIVFLHYKTGQEAIEKWNRRKSRVNKDCLIVKFSKMNGCTDNHLREFDRLEYEVKFAFNNERTKDLDSVLYIPGFDCCEQVLDDTTKYNSYVDLIKLINERKVVSKIF